MKIQVTHLKAPWPDGTKVGDVIEIDGDTLPAWAVGKCEAAGDTPVTLAQAPAEPEKPVAGKGKK